MAMYQIPAPTPLSLKGDVTENWKDFENSRDYYLIATDLRSKLKNGDGNDNPVGMEIVAATLCTVMGGECKKVMNSLPTLSMEDKKKPTRILEELRKHFVPQRNVLYERFVFNSANQKTTESIDEYVVRLHQLADSCEFGSLKASLIRDRIVIGTSDECGRERLLRERPVPDLEKVVESLRAAEIWNFYTKNNFKIQTCLFTKHESLQGDSPRAHPNILKCSLHSLVTKGIQLVGFATRAMVRESPTHCLIMSKLISDPWGGGRDL